MPRERVASNAIDLLRAIEHGEWSETMSFQVRVQPVIKALWDGASKEGIDPATVAPLVKWFARESGALAELVATHPLQSTVRPSERQGVGALSASLSTHASQWVKDGHFDTSAKVADEQADRLEVPGPPSSALPF